jgi:acetyl-CoA acetyltransferase
LENQTIIKSETERLDADSLQRSGTENRLGNGWHTEITAKYYKISREEQDELALKSHQNMAKAYDEGFFDDMITPAFGLNTDNNLRRDTSLEKLASLKPAFDKQNGTLTAGNSTPFTDGASAVLWPVKNGQKRIIFLF